MQCKHILTIIIYVVAINLFGFFLKFLEYTHIIFQYNTVDPPSSEYDYIVGKFVLIINQDSHERNLDDQYIFFKLILLMTKTWFCLVCINIEIKTLENWLCIWC